MSLWRRFFEAMGFGNSFRDSTLIIRGEDGTTVVNGTVVIDGVTIIDDETVIISGTQVKIDLGPETERTFEALGPISDAVSLSKEAPDIGLRLRKFNADISVVATGEVTAPAITVTGPQKIVESITSGLNDGFFELAVQEREIVPGSQISIQVLSAILSLGKRPRIQVQAKVPIGTALSLKNSGGSINTRGVLGDLDGKLTYGTKLDGDTFSSIDLNTGQSSRISVGSMNGSLSAKLAYGSTLHVTAGTISDCWVATGQNSEVVLDAASCGSNKLDLSYGTHATLAHVTGDMNVKTGQNGQVSIGAGYTESFSAKLGYGSKLNSRARAERLSVNTGQNSRVEFRAVMDSVTAHLSYGTHFTVSDGQRLSTVTINTGQNSRLRLMAESVHTLDLDLGYGSQFSSAAHVHQAAVKTGQNSKLFFTGTSDINSLDATLAYGSTLECRGSVSTFKLDAGQSSRITVAGDINKGSLRTAYATKVRARRVLPDVNTRGMSKQSELIITG